MTIYDGTAEARPLQGVTSLQSSLGEELGAVAGEAFANAPSIQGKGARELGGALAGQEDLGSQIGRLQAGEDLNDVLAKPRPGVDVPMDTARARVKGAGLDLNLGDQDSIKEPALDIMINRARDERERQATIVRGAGGFIHGALDVGTSMFVGALDPLSLAAFAIPVLGEARYGKMVADAGSAFLPRAGLGVAVGAQKGALGTLALAPLEAYAKTQEGQDYSMADTLRSMMYGAATIGLLHAGGGEVARLVHGTHVPAAALESEGLREGEIPGLAPSGGKPQPEAGFTPAEIIADLPPRAKEDVLRGALGSLLEDRPVQVAEHLEAAAKEDPRIAESVPPIEAFHGSPHEFDRFDASRIGTGEGAQSYGHGLYFAENEAVARSYQLMGDATIDGRPYDPNNPVHKAVSLVDEFGSREAAIRETKARAQHDPGDFYADVLRHLESDKPLPTLETGGRMYKVHIAADREHFLDWDKPLSEQSEHVRDALLKHPDPSIAGTAEKHGAVSGAALYGRLVARAQAEGGETRLPDVKAATSERLREAGIPGIKYLDQGSRRITDAEIRDEIERIKETEERAQKFGQAAAPGSIGWTAAKAAIARWEAQIGKPATHNFVVFDDKLIRITHKNGQEVGLDEMKAAQPESVPGPAPGTLRTGRPNVDALLHDPIVADAIANGPVNRANDVPYEAGASEGNDPTTNLDRHLPRQVVLESGTFDPAIPAKIHEQTEKRAMELLIAKFREREGREPNDKETNAIYETAHHEYAEVAEDAWYRSQGLDLKEVNAWWAKQDKITEHENPANPPANLYKKPYPHNVVEGVKHEEKGAAAEWPTSTAVEGGSSAGAGDNVVHVRGRKATGPRARPEETRSLFEHIAANGGLRDDDAMIPDVKSSLGRDNHFVPGFGNLIRKPGQLSTAAARNGARAPMSLDQARESAVHAGYLEDHGEHSGGVSTSTARDLLDAVDREASGNRVYRRGSEPPKSARDEAQHERDLDNHMEKTLGDYGVDTARIPSKTRARTLEIMDREGVTDPLDAYERAVMEETQHGAETGEHERIAETIPGWDLHDDAGAAPGAGGSPEAGGERPAGGAARDAGEGDRAAGRPAASARRGVADKNKAWRDLASAKGGHEDPSAIEAARAAEALPEPASIERDTETRPRVAEGGSAAEKADAESAELWRQMEPYLSEEDRKSFNDALAKIDQESADYQQIVRDGAACLAAAAGA